MKLQQHDAPSSSVGRAAYERFDPLATSYDSWFETALGSFADRAEQGTVEGLLRALPGERMLDLGAGTGRRARALAAAGVQCVGLEPSVAMLRVAARSAFAGGPAYVRGVGERLPFRDRSFDAVLCVNVLEFVTDVDAAVREAIRATKGGGRLVFGVLNSSGSWAAERRRRARNVWTHARFFEPCAIRARGNATCGVRPSPSPPCTESGLRDTRRAASALEAGERGVYRRARGRWG